MKTVLIVKEDGKIWVNEVPEEPKEDDYGILDSVLDFEDDLVEYQKDLDSAKETAVLCADQEQAQQIIIDDRLKRGDVPPFKHRGSLVIGLGEGIYPIQDLKWEKIWRQNNSYMPYEVAILTLSEQPKPHGFCVTPNSNCSMNYCDDNGCQDRRRELIEPKGEPMKDIKDYLHLYLGAGCIIKGGKGVTEDYYSTVEWADIGYPHNVKALVLRPLSDMTEEEKESCEMVYMRMQEMADEEGHVCDAEMWAETTRWLVSKGFDVFQLIEEGLAIDKTKLPNQ